MTSLTRSVPLLACRWYCLFSGLLPPPIQKWEARAVSAAVGKNQAPNVGWQAAISRSAVLGSAENLVCCFCWQCLPILTWRDCCVQRGVWCSWLTFKFMPWLWCSRFTKAETPSWAPGSGIMSNTVVLKKCRETFLSVSRYPPGMLCGHLPHITYQVRLSFITTRIFIYH